jgi:hypothetical protein
VWIKRRWLSLLMLPLAFLPMPPRDAEGILRVMHETKVDLTIPDEDDKGDGNRAPIELDRAQVPVECDEEARESSKSRGSEKASASNS